MDKDYGSEGPSLSPARTGIKQELSATPPQPTPPRKIGLSQDSPDPSLGINHPGMSAGMGVAPNGGMNGVDISMLGGMDPMAVAMLKRYQDEQQLLITRLLLQQRQQEDALLSAALQGNSVAANMLGNAPMPGAGGLDPRMQALLQQRAQIENGLHGLGDTRSSVADFVGTERSSSKNAPYFDASQAPDPPLDPEEEKDNHEPEDKSDGSVSDKDDKNKAQPKGGVSEPFPQKLYRMLEEAEANDQEAVLSFFPHGRAFAVHKPHQFIDEIMPKYFSTNRMSSFQRQLNLYGFRRVTEGRDKGGYFHEFFLKGRKGLLKKIKRKKTFGLKPTKEDLEDAARLRHSAMFGAGFGLGIPASHFGIQNASRDLLAQSLMMNGGQFPMSMALAGMTPNPMIGMAGMQGLGGSGMLGMGGGSGMPGMGCGSGMPGMGGSGGMPGMGGSGGMSGMGNSGGMTGIAGNSMQGMGGSDGMQAMGGSGGGMQGIGGNGGPPAMGENNGMSGMGGSGGTSGMAGSSMQGMGGSGDSMQGLGGQGMGGGMQGMGGSMHGLGGSMHGLGGSMQGMGGDATTAALLREQKQSELLLAQLQQQRQQMAAYGGMLGRNQQPM